MKTIGRWRSTNGCPRLAVKKYHERGCHSHAVILCSLKRAFRIDFHDFEAPVQIARKLAKRRLELSTRGARLREKLDQDGSLVLEDLARKGVVVGVVQHKNEPNTALVVTGRSYQIGHFLHVIASYLAR